MRHVSCKSRKHKLVNGTSFCKGTSKSLHVVRSSGRLSVPGIEEPGG